MKRCPKCQSSYTDDTLGFCLQDGTALLNIRDILASADTLEMRNLPTESMGRSVPTLTPGSGNSQDQANSQGQINSQGQVNSQGLPVYTLEPAVHVKTNKALVGGVFLIAALLLVLVGIITAMFIRWSYRDRTRGGNNQNINQTINTPGNAQALKITVVASSTRKSMQGNDYFPENVIDQNLASAWIEGADGPGRGSWIRCDFDREVALTSIKIYPGYFKNPAAWAKNNRISEGTLTFSDGSSVQVSFPNQMQPQEVATKGVRTRSVKLTVDDYYAGTQDFNDTAVSELSFVWQP